MLDSRDALLVRSLSESSHVCCFWLAVPNMAILPSDLPGFRRISQLSTCKTYRRPRARFMPFAGFLAILRVLQELAHAERV